MKSTPKDGEMPKDPNDVTSRTPAFHGEPDNRPMDPNHVTSDKAVHSSESDNRPGRPTI